MAIGDVKADSDISPEFSIGIISRSADVPDATIFAVMTPQAIVHFKRLAIIESFVVGLETLGHVRRMNTFGPSITEFLLKGTSREIEPAPVEVITFFIHARVPHRTWKTGEHAQIKVSRAIDGP